MKKQWKKMGGKVDLLPSVNIFHMLQNRENISGEMHVKTYRIASQIDAFQSSYAVQWFQSFYWFDIISG